MRRALAMTGTAGIIALSLVIGVSPARADTGTLTGTVTDADLKNFFDEEIRAGRYLPPGEAQVLQSAAQSTLQTGLRTAARVAGKALIGVSVGLGIDELVYPEETKYVTDRWDSFVNGTSYLPPHNPALPALDLSATPGGRVPSSVWSAKLKAYPDQGVGLVMDAYSDIDSWFAQFGPNAQHPAVMTTVTIDCVDANGALSTLTSGGGADITHWTAGMHYEEGYSTTRCPDGMHLRSAQLRNRTYGEWLGGASASDANFKDFTQSDPPATYKLNMYFGLEQGFNLSDGTPPAGGLVFSNTTKCQRPDGTVFDVTTRGVNGGPAPAGKCTDTDPAATPLTSTTAAAPAAGGTPVPTNTITRTPSGQYPACSSSACNFAVYMGGQPCTVGLNSCPSWTMANMYSPGSVSCQYGPYAVPVEFCYPLEKAYDPTPWAATPANTDGDPNTSDSPAGNTGTNTGSNPGTTTGPGPTNCPVGAPVYMFPACPNDGQFVIANPGTGTQPSPSPSPSPSTGTYPGPYPSPSASPGTDPGTGTGTTPGTTPQPGDPDYDPCQGAGEGVTGWIADQVGCALKRAFVPDQTAVEQSVRQMQDTWAGTAPVKMSNAIAGWAGMMPHLDGCQGPKVSFHWYSIGGDYYPMDACTGPLATAAPIARLVGAITLYFGAGLAVSRYLGGTFGFMGLGKGGGE